MPKYTVSQDMYRKLLPICQHLDKTQPLATSKLTYEKMLNKANQPAMLSFFEVAPLNTREFYDAALTGTVTPEFFKTLLIQSEAVLASSYQENSFTHHLNPFAMVVIRALREEVKLSSRGQEEKKIHRDYLNRMIPLFLADERVDVNQEFSYIFKGSSANRTLLQWAVHCHDLDAMRLLMQSPKIDVNKQVRGETALSILLNSNLSTLEQLELLLTDKNINLSDFTVRSGFFNPVLFSLCDARYWYKDFYMAKRLLADPKVDINGQFDKNDDTSLFAKTLLTVYAGDNTHIESLKLLLQHPKFNPQRQLFCINKNGDTMLIKAAYFLIPDLNNNQYESKEMRQFIMTTMLAYLIIDKCFVKESDATKEAEGRHLDESLLLQYQSAIMEQVFSQIDSLKTPKKENAASYIPAAERDLCWQAAIKWSQEKTNHDRVKEQWNNEQQMTTSDSFSMSTS